MTANNEKLLKKIKNKIDDIFYYPSEKITYFDEENDEEGFNLVEFLNKKIKFKKNSNNEDKIRKKYLNREQAIYIANLDKNFKKHMYDEAVNNGFTYGIIELDNFYTTLVKYQNNLYWYVKVINGRYGIKDNDKNKRGYFDEYSNIRGLVNAINGKFIYIDDEFDTKHIKMISDDEFLEILFDFRK